MRDNINPTIFKIKHEYWEAERLSTGDWALLNPGAKSNDCIIVPDNWFRENFSVVNGPQTYHRSDERYGNFVEN